MPCIIGQFIIMPPDIWPGCVGTCGAGWVAAGGLPAGGVVGALPLSNEQVEGR